MREVFYAGSTLSGRAASLIHMFPTLPGETAPRLEFAPNLAYWRRLREGVLFGDGETVRVAVGCARIDNLFVPSLVDWERKYTGDHASVGMSVACLRQCQGVVLVANAVRGLEHARHVFNETNHDLRQLGRDPTRIPFALQVTFQDRRPLDPAVVGAALGVPPRLCFASIPVEGVGVREPLLALLREIEGNATQLEHR